jgi:DNA primase
MRIPESTLSEIRGKLDIAEVIGEHVALQRKGGRFWGLCPFHQEKSPSFTVTPDKGVYYCFGCHKGGTVFDFVMEVEKVPWRDAVEILAKKAGIEIPREDEELGGIKRETFFELYRRVAGSFQWLLGTGAQAEAARHYLAERGVTQETIGKFQLGYAPPDRDWLFKFLTQKSYSADFLARTGLFAENSQRRSMALFANRIMFPICNPRGEILAFGGRILGEGQPKYLNSPETPFFRKGENLYGMERAGPAIRRAEFFIVVEGYMDVLSMHQAGFENCVAPLGTALTEQQVRVLRRYAGRGVLMFDGDEAGRKATARAIEMLESQDVIVAVVEIPGGEDPADFVKKGDLVALKGLLEHPRESFPYLVEKALAANERTGTAGREKIRDWLFPFIAAPVSQLRRDGYMNLLADTLGADVQALRQDFQAWTASRRRYGGGAPAAGRAEPRGQGAPAAGGASVASDLFLMLAVSANRELFALVRKGGVILSDLEDERARALFVALEESFRAEEPDFETFCGRIEDAALKDLVIRKASSGEFDMNQERLVADGVRRIRQRALRRKIDMLATEMKTAEKGTADPARLRELLAEKMHLDSELERLKTRAAGA